MENTNKTSNELDEQLNSDIQNSESPKHIELNFHDGVGTREGFGGRDKTGSIEEDEDINIEDTPEEDIEIDSDEDEDIEDDDFDDQYTQLTF